MFRGIICISILLATSINVLGQNDHQLQKITLNQIKELILNSSELLGKTPEEIKGMSRPSFINDRLNMWTVFKVIDMRDDTVKSIFSINELIRIHTGCGILDIMISRKSNLSFALFYRPVSKVTKEKTDDFLIKSFSLKRKDETRWGISKNGSDVIIEFSTKVSNENLETLDLKIVNQRDKKILYYDN